MDWTQILVILVAYTGFGAGYALRRIAPEEVRDGRKYFLILEKLLLVAAFVPALYVSIVSFSLFWLLICLIGLITALYARGRYKIAALALVLGLLIVSTQNSPLYALEASMVFLYGLVGGTLAR